MKKRMISFALSLTLILILAIPVGAAVSLDDTVEPTTLETIHDIFTHKGTCQVFDSNGNDITTIFLQRNQSNYDNENFAAIAKDMGDNGVCTFEPTQPTAPTIAPRIDLWTSVTCKITMTYKYNGTKTATAETHPRVKAYVHDSTGNFISVHPAVLENSKSGLTGATVSGGGHDVLIDGGNSRTSQQVHFKVSKNGKSVYSNWSTVWWAGQNTLKATRIDLVGSL